MREELERRRESTGRASATAMNSTPRSREQAAELLRRGPEPTREQALQAFVAAVKRNDSSKVMRGIKAHLIPKGSQP